MGEMYGSCGHQVSDDAEGVWWWDRDRLDRVTGEFFDAQVYGILCDLCKLNHELIPEDVELSSADWGWR